MATIVALCFTAAHFALALGQETGPSELVVRNFRDCLGGRVPLTLPKDPTFSVLATQSYRNSHATPRAIVRPHSERHVQDAVSCAWRSEIQVCAKSGGHSLIGSGLCNGVLIDLSAMRAVTFSNPPLKTRAKIQAGAVLGEVLHALWNGNRRWFASGVCPGVGVGGYVFGGGHGPYEGTLGMACDALISVRMVDRNGEVVVASRKKNSHLFWALCGAGGSQFGVIVSFKIRTVPSTLYDRGVVFRFKWTDHARAGEVLHKWQQYGENGGLTWFRLEMYRETAETGITGYGACYDVDSQEECLARLEKEPFFNVPSRTTEFIGRVQNALQLHAFFSGDGGWGRTFANDTNKALLGARNVDAGQANERLFRSAMLTYDPLGGDAPSVQAWQRYADFCRDPGRESIPWHVCELNLFNNAIDKRQDNAFAHRGAHVVSHYIIGGGTTADKTFAYNKMKELLLPVTTGVYVNYPELQLGQSEYPRMYWGGSLPRLLKVKAEYDQGLLFANPQPIPAW